MPKRARAQTATAIGAFVAAVLGCAARPTPPEPLARVGAERVEGPPASSSRVEPAEPAGPKRDARRTGAPQATAYDQAVDAFARQVAELDAGLPVERRLPAVHRAIVLLAAAIERIPRGEGLALGEAAAEIRREVRDLEGAPLESGVPTSVVKRALILANANLRLVAERPYAHTPRVGVSVTLLGYAITTITERRPLAFELVNVIASLREAAVVLRAIQSAAATLDAETPE